MERLILLDTMESDVQRAYAEDVDQWLRIHSIPWLRYKIGSISVEIVWEPRWNPEMMSPDGKKILGWVS